MLEVPCWILDIRSFQAERFTRGQRTVLRASRRRSRLRQGPGKTRRAAARLHKQAYIPAASGDGGPCFAEAASQGKPVALQLGDNLEIRKAGRKRPLSNLFS